MGDIFPRKHCGSNSSKEPDVEELITQLLSDPILSDIHKGVTPEEVDKLIGLEQGQAMSLCVKKLDGSVLDVIVEYGCLVEDLKLAIQVAVSRLEEPSMGSRRISWKHVWRKWCLKFEETGEVLNDSSRKLIDCGIRNGSTITYAFNSQRVRKRKGGGVSGSHQSWHNSFDGGVKRRR